MAVFLFVKRKKKNSAEFFIGFVIGQWVRTQDFRELKTEKTEIAPDMT